MSEMLDAMDNWIIEGHEPRRVPWAEWLAWRTADKDNTARRVAEDRVGESWVSTVFLTVDHGYGGVPILFETMVFEGPMDQMQWRYTTWDEAAAGHARVVAAMRSGQVLDD